ncbi:MAG TPA: site-2 protease family protein [Gemmatimonadales bacterium]|nr:site-2 protease family protein [Gemmatimonadales bacterium]
MRLEEILLLIPVLLFSVVAHEYAHAEAAYRQGDSTAYMLGRLTLNPLKHIDPFLTIILPAILIAIHAPAFGGAKPVPVNPRNYRNYKRGEIIVSLAGIATNLVLFVLSVIGYAVVGLLARPLAAIGSSLAILQSMMWVGMYINLFLAFFNLIPLPPLDGSHVLKLLLPPSAGARFRQLYALGVIPILAVVWFLPGVIDVFLWPAYQLLGVALSLVGGFHLAGALPS